MVTTPNLARRLRREIIIQQQVTTRDTHGQATQSWTTFATVQGAVEPLQGREFFAADQTNAETSVRIRIRYLSGITQAMRVSFNSKLYNIEAIINPQEKDRELQLMCSEGVNSG